MPNCIYVIVLSYFLVHLAIATWRLTPLGLPYHHYFEKSAKPSFVKAGDTWIATDLRENNVTWLASPNCYVYSATSASQTFSYTTIGNYTFGINETDCLTCLDDYDPFNFMVVDSSSCYFWHVMESLQGSFVQFEIMVSSQNLIITDDRRAMAAFTNLFYSRGEIPVLKFGKQLIKNVSYDFNPSTKKWVVLFPKQEIFSSFLTISSTHGIALFGCKIAPTIVFSKYIKRLGDFFDHKDKNTHSYLKGKPDIVGKISYHPCFPERSLLATNHSILYTADDFATVVKLKFDFNAFPDLEMADINVGLFHLFFVASGKLFAANVDDFENYQEIIFGVGVDILGSQSYPLCLQNRLHQRYLTWESAFLVAWSSKRLYVTNEVNSDITLASNWRLLQLPREYKDYSIKKAKLGTNSNLWILVYERTTHLLLECSFLSTVSLSCSELTVMADFLPEISDWDFIKSAHASALVWSSSKIRFGYDQEERKGFFNYSAKTIIFDPSHSLWLVQTSDNLLYYGSGKTTVPTLLRRVDLQNATNFTYKFREVDGQVIRISWNADNVTTEIYPLFQEIYNVAQGSERDLCDFGFISWNVEQLGGNAVLLDAINSSIMITFTVYKPPNVDLSFSFRSNFIDLVTLINTSWQISLLEMPGKPPLTVRTYETFLTGTCLENGPTCNRDLALYEMEILLKDGSATCLAPASEVIYVNVTCEDGLHVRIRSDRFEESRDSNASYWPTAISGCSYEYEDSVDRDSPKRVAACYYTLSHPYEFYPILETYEFDKYVQTVEDDVRMVEINNRTGIELKDFNLVLKDCFLCSNFKNRTSESELILQVAERACPCRLDKYNGKRWLSSVNLGGVGEPGDVNVRNLIRFQVKVMGKSYCDLTTFLTILVLPVPKVAVRTLQVNIIWVFVAFTLFLLIISYWTYRRDILRMKKQAQQIHSK